MSANFYLNITKDTPYVIDFSIMTLMQVSTLMQKSLRYITTSGSALTVSRTSSFKATKGFMDDLGDDPKNTYVLLMDNDILIDMKPDDLKNCFMEAEEKGINIIGNYHKRDGTSTIIHKETHEPFNFESIKDNYASMADYYFPLGFYYGKLPLDYKWKMDGSKGEDYYFIDDNPEVAKNTYLDDRIKLLHYKSNYV